MEKIVVEFISKKEKERIIKYFNAVVIEARRLNAEGKKSVSNPMHGTEYLHDLLRDQIIENSMYVVLKELAENPALEYTIVI